MAQYPEFIKTFREKLNFPGEVYQADQPYKLFVEDLTQLEDEVVAIETDIINTVKPDITNLQNNLETTNGNVADLETSKQDALGFTPENTTNKDTGETLTDSTTKYGSSHSIRAYIATAIAGLQTALGFTPENVANKETGDAPTDNTTKYPSSHTLYKYIADQIAKYATKIYTASGGGDTTITIGSAWTAYAVPNTTVSVTPTINSKAIVDGLCEVNRSTNASQEQDICIQVKIGSAGWVTLGNSGLSDIGGNAYQSWNVSNKSGDQTMTAGTTYQFRLVYTTGSTGSVTVRARYLRVIVIPDL